MQSTRHPRRQSLTQQTQTSSTAVFHHARVIARGTNRSLAVVCETGSLCASVADGCLLRPDVGDMVLVSVTEHDAYVVTVLARAGQSGGAVVLDMGEGVMLAAESGVLSIEAERASLRFAHCDWSSGVLHCHGDEAEFSWRDQRTWSERSVEDAAEKREYFREASRHVAGHEEHSANSLRQRVTEDWSAQAKDISLFGTERVKADTDGDIQLG